MRIIAGTKKGLKLQSPASDVSRPILDRVKESLFSVLYKYDQPRGKVVADLFSGVGSLGLEALSRGAQFVTFVEKDPKIIAVLKKNIERAGFSEKTGIVRTDAFRFGPPVAVQEHKYELVFVDPPYSLTKQAGEGSLLSRLFDRLAEQISDGAIIVVRTDKRTETLDSYGKIGIIERRSWGSMKISIYGKRSDGQ